MIVRGSSPLGKMSRKVFLPLSPILGRHSTFKTTRIDKSAGCRPFRAASVSICLFRVGTELELVCPPPLVQRRRGGGSALRQSVIENDGLRQVAVNRFPSAGPPLHQRSVKEQGEGTTASPFEGTFDPHDLAHFCVFKGT